MSEQTEISQIDRQEMTRVVEEIKLLWNSKTTTQEKKQIVDQKKQELLDKNDSVICDSVEPKKKTIDQMKDILTTGTIPKEMLPSVRDMRNSSIAILEATAHASRNNLKAQDIGLTEQTYSFFIQLQNQMQNGGAYSLMNDESVWLASILENTLSVGYSYEKLRDEYKGLKTRYGHQHPVFFDRLRTAIVMSSPDRAQAHHDLEKDKPISFDKESTLGQLKQLDDQRLDWVRRFNAFAHGIMPTESLRQQVESDVLRDYGDQLRQGFMTQADINKEIDSQVQQRLASMRKSLELSMSEISHNRFRKTMREMSEGNTLDPSETARNVEEDVAHYRRYLNENFPYIPSAQREQIAEHAREYFKLIGKVNMINSEMMRSGDNLEQMAARYNVLVGKKNKAVLEALTNSDYLVRFFEASCMRNINGVPQFDVEMFWHQLRDFCSEDVLSVTDEHLNEDFNHAFSQMYQGAFYNLLIQRVKQLAGELSSSGDSNHRKYANLTVSFHTRALMRTEGQSDLGPQRQQTRQAVRNMSLTDAIGGEIVENLEYLLRSKMAMHNINYIVRNGVGWEQLKNYVAICDTTLVDWMLVDSGGLLNEAYQRYIENLRKQLYLNDYTMGADWGNPSAKGLDRTQKVAMQQMVAYMHTKRPDVPLDKLENEARRYIVMATGISMAVTGEYWGALRYANLPVGSKSVTMQAWEIEQINKEIREDNREIMKQRREIEAKNADRRSRGQPLLELPELIEELKQGAKRYEFDTWGASVGMDKAQELMAYNLFLNWRRWGIPGVVKQLPYVYRPRDFDSYSKQREYGAYETFRHTSVYRVHREKDDAFMQGASRWYMQFYKKNVILADDYNINMIGVVARKGWRNKQYEAELYKGPDGKIDIYKTLSDIMVVGGALGTREFIDSLGSLDNLTDPKFVDAVLNWSARKGKKEADLSEQEKKDRDEFIVKYSDPKNSSDQNKALKLEAFKRALYEQFVFGWEFKTAPTSALGYERREYTLRGEKLVLEDCREFLDTTWGTRYPKIAGEAGKRPHDAISKDLMELYTGAIQIAEKMMYDRRKADFQHNCGDTRTFSELKEFEKFNKFQELIEITSFKQEDLHDPEVRKAIRVYLDSFLRDHAEISTQYRDYHFKFLEGEEGSREFMKSLSGFYDVMTKSIAKDRTEIDGNGETYRTTLGRRFTEWHKDYGILDHDLGLAYTNLDEFNFSSAGSRMHQRWIGETFNLAQQLSKNFQAILVEGAVGVTKASWSSHEEFEKLLRQIFVKPTKEIYSALTNIDQAGFADVFVRNTAIYLNRLLSRDADESLPLVGNLISTRNRWAYGKQGSLMQDYAKSVLGRSTRSLDVEESKRLGKIIMNEGGEIPWKEDDLSKVGYRPGGLFGKAEIPDIYELDEEGRPKFEKVEKRLFKNPFTKKYVKIRIPQPVLKKDAKNATFADQFFASEGLRVKDRFLKKSVIIGTAVAIAILIAMILLAAQKNKKK